MNDAIGVTLGALAIIVTVTGGFLKALYGRIREVESAQLDINGDIREDMQKISGELRQAMQTQASDHRIAQNNLWEELRRMGDRSAEQHTRAAENVSRLPTREEIAKGMEAMEARLTIMLRKEVEHR